MAPWADRRQESGSVQHGKNNNAKNSEYSDQREGRAKGKVGKGWGKAFSNGSEVGLGGCDQRKGNGKGHRGGARPAVPLEEEKKEILGRATSLKEKIGDSKALSLDDRADLEDLLQSVLRSSNGLQQDRQIALALVNISGASLKHFSEALRDDYDVVMAAVEHDGNALEHASQALRGNKDIVLKAAQTTRYALQLATPDLRNDPEVVLGAVKSHGLAVQFASPELQADLTIGLAAIQSDGQALRYLSSDFRHIKEAVMEAVKTYPAALRIASHSLHDDKDVALVAVQRGGPLALRNVSPSLQEDRDVVRAAIGHGGTLVLEAFARSGSAREDKDLTFWAVHFAPNEEDARECYEYHRRAVRDVDRRLKFSEEELEELRTILPAARSSLAIEGQRAPVVSVTVMPAPAGNDDNDDHDNKDNKIRASSYLCKCCLLSGKSFTCEVSNPGVPLQFEYIEVERSVEPIVQDLAQTVLDKLPELTQMPGGTKHVFLTIGNGNGEAELVTPFDWNRPLRDFLPTSANAA